MLEGYFYHIYNRGINKSPIFFENKNYKYFLQQFDKYLLHFIDVYSYCLMPNHFHFLIKIKENEKPEKIADYPKVPNVKTLTPLEKAFRDFFICYSKSINKAQNRTGALFQARFKRKCITKDTYLIRIIPYIHLNPVRSGLCSKPDEWKFSSYNSIISDKETKIKRIEILKWFNDIESFIKIHKEYREYQKERDYLFKNS